MSKNVTGHTKLLCLLGSPVEHSISPAMHNLAADTLGLDYEYLAFDVGEADLKEVTDALKKMGVAGFNLTMPDKNRMAQLCDELSPAAQIGRAVNTVVNDNGRFIGHTTDGVGFMKSAEAEGVILPGKRMVQLGAGGAGTAILIQAALDGLRSIDVFNIKDAFWPRLTEVVSQLNERTSCEVRLHELSDMKALRGAIAGADVLVNTTPVGMTGREGCLITDAGFFHEGLVVADIIYEPRQTQLLKMAADAGLKTFNGMYMLMYQGAASFRLWTGHDMPIDTVRKLFEDR